MAYRVYLVFVHLNIPVTFSPCRKKYVKWWMFGLVERVPFLHSMKFPPFSFCPQGRSYPPFVWSVFECTYVLWQIPDIPFLHFLGQFLEIYRTVIIALFCNVTGTCIAI